MNKYIYIYIYINIIVLVYIYIYLDRYIDGCWLNQHELKSCFALKSRNSNKHPHFHDSRRMFVEMLVFRNDNSWTILGVKHPHVPLSRVRRLGMERQVLRWTNQCGITYIISDIRYPPFLSIMGVLSYFAAVFSFTLCRAGSTKIRIS